MWVGICEQQRTTWIVCVRVSSRKNSGVYFSQGSFIHTPSSFRGVLHIKLVEILWSQVRVWILKKEVDVGKLNGRKVFGVFLVSLGVLSLYAGVSRIDTLRTFESAGGKDITFAGYLSVISEWFGYFLVPALLLYFGYRKLKAVK